MRLGRGLWVLVVGLAAVLVVAGCGQGAGVPEAGGGVPGGGGAVGGGSGAVVEVGFNGTDIAWIQLMVAMDESVLGLAAQVTGRLRDKIETVRKGHEAELVRLKDLRKRSGIGDANPHAGHVMPGLITTQDLADVGDERRVATKLAEHFEQRILLAQGVGSSGTHTEVKSLATAIEQASIDALASWRALSMNGF